MKDAISGVTGLICAVIAILIWTVGGKHTPRLVVGLVITASMGFFGTRLGVWVQQGLGWLTGWMDTATRLIVGGTVVGLVAIVTGYILIHDLGIVAHLMRKVLHGGGGHGGGPAGGGGVATTTRGGGGGGGGWLGKLLGPAQIRNRTLLCAASLPFTAISAPGVAGTVMLWLLGAWGGGVAWLIRLLFGAH